MAKTHGKWQKGDFNRFTSDEMRVKFKQAGLGVKKPHHIQPKEKGGKVVAWRI